MVNSSPSSQSSKSRNLIAGVDNIIFDQRAFQIDSPSLIKICRFFSLGNLIDFQLERDVVVSHSNFFVYVRTQRGRYALKFHPSDSKRTILHELAVNRFLRDRQCLTPTMHVNAQGKPFYAYKNMLATCYSFIDGEPVWRKLTIKGTTNKIIGCMHSLKQILSTLHLAYTTTSYGETLNGLYASPILKSTSAQNKIIHLSLKKSWQTFKTHPGLFKQQWLHNNTSLTNLLLTKKDIFILDLSHIQKDYGLSDLSALIISCLFLKIPKAVVNNFIKSYFHTHQLTREHWPVLDALLAAQLTKEFIKNSRREKLVKSDPQLLKTSKDFLFHLKTRTALITTALKKLNDSSRV